MTIQHLINYPVESQEQVLGKFFHFCGRAELQTLVGNVPQYLFLFRLDATIDEVKAWIASAKKPLMEAFGKLLHSHMKHHR